jgi:osmotically-inducible protein OsmY
MKSDLQIQKDVIEELKWEPFLKSSEIGVAVKNGIVTLSGQVDSLSKKLAAENAVKKISGVKAIAEEIQIGVSPAYNKSDTEIAEAILNALRWHTGVQEETIKIKVENGVVRMEGEVEWEYQRTSAQSTIKDLAGVKSVLNFITVKPKIVASDIKKKICSAFQRNAIIDAKKINVDVLGANITLSGKVRSFAEKEDAEQAAWNAPGVMSVVSKLEIEEPEFPYE